MAVRSTLLILIVLAACGRPSESGPDAAPPLDAPPPYDPPPQVAPCEVLGFPTPLFPLTEEILAVADVDGDGRLDLITSTFSSVNFYRGSGATFAPKVVSSIGTAPPYFPSAVAVADLDGDGKLDLVVAIQEPISLVVMRGDGAGAFQPGASYPSTAVGSVAAGDFNGDGKPDIAYTGSSTSATVNVRLNTGAGTLGAETTIAVGDFPTSVALADLDGDGALDVIVSSDTPSTLSILRGNGDGTFEPRVDVATIRSPWKIVVADLNADGHPDLVVAAGSSGISVHVNDGSGAFLDHVDYETATFLSRTPFVVGDLDRDGKLDVVTGNLVVLAGNGDGSLRPATETHLIDDGMGPLAMGDLNGDGEPDVLLGGLIGHYNGLGVLESNGKGGFNTRVQYDMGGSANGVVPYDFNHDGYVDLVLSGSDIRLGLGKPGAMFGDPRTIAKPGGSVSVGDFNGDQIADLLVARYGSDLRLTVSLGNGDGSFRDPSPELVLMPFFNATTVAFALGDLDGDGKTDIIVGGGRSGLSAYLSNGDGMFHQVVLDSRVDLRFVTPSVADVNGDGQPDIVVSWYKPDLEGGPPISSATDVWLNQGNGAFSTVAVDATALSFTVADLDGDGRLDLFRGSTFRRGNGDGTFQPGVPTGITSPVSGSRLVDITGDGKLDYVVLDSAARVPVTIYQGLGTGSFGAPTTYYGLTGAGQIADIDHDGRLDIILPGNTLNVMFARCLK